MFNRSHASIKKGLLNFVADCLCNELCETKVYNARNRCSFIEIDHNEKKRNNVENCITEYQNRVVLTNM